MAYNVLIVGGGFGGISVALTLKKNKPRDVEITLVSDKPHFEYTPALYRVVTGSSSLEVCIPLREIFKGRAVEVFEDAITEVDLDQKSARSGGG